MIRLLEHFRPVWRNAVREVKQATGEVGRPFDRVDSVFYTSPPRYQPDREAQVIYRERVDRARERKGLPPINWT